MYHEILAALLNGRKRLRFLPLSLPVAPAYSMLKERIAFRKKWAEQLGLGFEIPSQIALIGRNGRKIGSEAVLELAATA